MGLGFHHAAPRRPQGVPQEDSSGRSDPACDPSMGSGSGAHRDPIRCNSLEDASTDGKCDSEDVTLNLNQDSVTSNNVSHDERSLVVVKEKVKATEDIGLQCETDDLEIPVIIVEVGKHIEGDSINCYTQQFL